MTYAEILASIGRVPLVALQGLRQQLYAAHGSGTLTDDEAGALDAAIEERKRGGGSSRPTPFAPVSLKVAVAKLFPPRIRRPVKDRSAARQRRRLIASSGPMPPAIAALFTEGERAALGVIADEVAARGSCRLSVAELASRAGCCDRLVQRAVREARLLGLISVEARPDRGGRKSDTNIIRVLSREWAAWLARRRGERRVAPSDIKGLRGGIQGSSGGRGAFNRTADRPSVASRERSSHAALAAPPASCRAGARATAIPQASARGRGSFAGSRPAEPR